MIHPSPMTQALLMAQKALEKDEVPVGAVLIYNNEIIAKTHNLVEFSNDPTAHAEILLLREAGSLLGSPHLINCDVYVTLEPCTMCASALAHARIRRLFFGAYDPKGGAIDHGVRFYQQATCLHRPEVVGGIQEKECGALLKSFFRDKRL